MAINPYHLPTKKYQVCEKDEGDGDLGSYSSRSVHVPWRRYSYLKNISRVMGHIRVEVHTETSYVDADTY